MNWRPGWEINPGSVNFRLPLYIPLALTLTPAAFLWRREIKRRRRVKAGGCARCGYDMTGLAGGAAATCPECGNPPH